MIDEIKWYIKPSASGTYSKMPQPTEYDIEVEDLDDGTFRNIVTGDMIDNVVSINWTKAKFKFDKLTKEQAYDILKKVSVNPIYAKLENPIYANNFVEAKFRCSKKTISKVKTTTTTYAVSFNLVQKNKVAGM